MYVTLYRHRCLQERPTRSWFILQVLADSRCVFWYVCRCFLSAPTLLGLYDRGQNNTSNQTSNQTGNTTGSLCFQPNDGGCDDMTLPPVICPVQSNTTCALICSQTSSCVSDPNNHGSFCKENAVCFGLYWTNSTQSSACYAPTDPNCPTTFPISCTPAGGVSTTPSVTESTQTSSGGTETTTETSSEAPTTETTTESGGETTTETATETTTETVTSETTTETVV